MYSLILPIYPVIEIFELTTSERIEMIRMSLMFKTCRKNTIYAIMSLLLDILSFSLNVFVLYSASLNNIHCFVMISSMCMLLAFYLVVDFVIYINFDVEDFRRSVNRIGNMDGESFEEFERVISSSRAAEESNQEISVSTEDIGGCLETITD